VKVEDLANLAFQAPKVLKDQLAPQVLKVLKVQVEKEAL
jgi:hypothetical protein